jgi:hypothetical protein
MLHVRVSGSDWGDWRGLFAGGGGEAFVTLAEGTRIAGGLKGFFGALHNFSSLCAAHMKAPADIRGRKQRWLTTLPK